MSQDAIVSRGMGKRFRRYSPSRATTFQETLLSGFRRKRVDVFWALQDLTFSVASGQTIGIIGSNGSGKSTLLKLLAGVGRPEVGTLQVNGRVGALLDLGAAFHGDLSGRENVHVAAVVAGLSRREATKRFDSIVAFAELADFIDNPYRTYSSGMKLRLAFAVAVHADPEVLVMDEVLSVGDHGFQSKCQEKLTSFQRQGCTLVLASHDMVVVRRLCDKVLWLREGKVVRFGSAEETVREYLDAPKDETRRRTPREGTSVPSASGVELKLHENRFGSQELEVTEVALLDERGKVVNELDAGDALRVEVRYATKGPVRSPIFTVSITSDDGVSVCEVSTASAGVDVPLLEGAGCIALDVGRLDLNRGQYWVDIGVYSPEWEYAYDHHTDVYPFRVRTLGEGNGIFSPPHRWDLSGVPELQGAKGAARDR